MQLVEARLQVVHLTGGGGALAMHVWCDRRGVGGLAPHLFQQLRYPLLVLSSHVGMHGCCGALNSPLLTTLLQRFAWFAWFAWASLV